MKHIANRKRFLLLFTREMLKNLQPLQEPPQERHTEYVSEEEIKPYQVALPPSINPTVERKPSQNMIPSRHKPVKHFPVQNQKPLPVTKPKQGYPNLGKLNVLLADPRINSIECPGANKNVMVKKDGTLQRTPLVLTKEEIKKVIQDFSEVTRIPLVGGTFKAVSSNLMMTAVVSDYVDSRFVLQKRNPFHPYD